MATDIIARGMAAGNGGGSYPPAEGIPKDDLAVDVRESLSRADFSYQKPVSGIPVSDLAQNILSSSLAWGKETHGAVDSGAITLPSVENANIVNELTYIFSASSANLSITAPSGYILGDDSGFAGLSAGNTIAYTNLTVGSIYEMSFKVLDATHIGMVKKEWKTA